MILDFKIRGATINNTASALRADTGTFFSDLRIVISVFNFVVKFVTQYLAYDTGNGLDASICKLIFVISFLIVFSCHMCEKNIYCDFFLLIFFPILACVILACLFFATDND